LLRTVLFPHMPLSLHVFEERYREMMRDCLDAGTSFGVVGIRSGGEVGGAAQRHDVGTLARIVHVQRLDDGRMSLLITGATRFRILRDVPGKAYAQGEVQYLDEDDSPAAPELVSDLSPRFERYISRLQRVTGGDTQVPDLPSEPELLGYLVAATLEGSMESKQRLLEAPGVETRLRMELAILRREEDLLRRGVVPVASRPGNFSAN
jgi:Lon protease-like protein